MDDDGGMDALFSTFLNEVSNIKSAKVKKTEDRLGTPEEIVDRIMNMPYDPKKGIGSAFGILQISPEASESEITKHYRKVSMLIHPDKCKLEQASEAFQILVRAYNDTKDPSHNDKYKDIHQEAKNRVRKARTEENKARAKKGEDPLDMEGNEFDTEVLKECERMTNESAEKTSYTNSVYEANMKRQEQMIKEAKQRRREEDAEKRKFEQTRDKRAAGWQTFMNNIESKKFKSQHIMGKVGAADSWHKRETRDEAVHGKASLDMEDNRIKRSDTQAGQAGIDRDYRKVWR